MCVIKQSLINKVLWFRVIGFFKERYDRNLKKKYQSRESRITSFLQAGSILNNYE